MLTGTQRLPWTSTNHEKFITVTSEVKKKTNIIIFLINQKISFFIYSAYFKT